MRSVSSGVDSEDHFDVIRVRIYHNTRVKFYHTKVAISQKPVTFILSRVGVVCVTYRRVSDWISDLLTPYTNHS
jgi:hypothetical protein